MDICLLSVYSRSYTHPSVIVILPCQPCTNTHVASSTHQLPAMRVALTSPCLAPLPLCARVTRRNRLATLKCRASYSKKTERKVELPGTALPKDPTPPAEPSTANTEAAQASTSSSSENAQPSGTTEVCARCTLCCLVDGCVCVRSMCNSLVQPHTGYAGNHRCRDPAVGTKVP